MNIKSFNRFSLMTERLNWYPDFYCVADDLVLLDLFNNDVELNGILNDVRYAFFPSVHPKGITLSDRIDNRDNLLWLKYKFGKNFSEKLPYVYGSGSVIYEGFQILNYLGFKDIYILGVDMNYQLHDTVKNLDNDKINIISQLNDDPNHFDPRYFGKGKSYHQPVPDFVNKVLNSLDYINSISNKLNLNIFNVGIDSKVKSFPKLHFEDLFDYSMTKSKV